ncbi:MAG: glycosyltransferase family 4 protein [Lachnospiraceae bacterium]|nr:glycosyltransferase family 4 protein [Lachnospiraceae bacterium]
MEYPLDLAGGGQMSTQTLCGGLAEYKADGGRTFEPVVICPKLLTKKAADFSFEVLEYDALENREDKLVPRLKNFFSRMGSFKRLIKEAAPDLIHVSMSESLLTYEFIRRDRELRSIPFVYTDRGLCYGYRAHTKLFMKRALRGSFGMICTTEFNKRLWEKEEPGLSITVIPNTISPVFAEFEEGKRQDLREKYGIENTLVIGFAGRISEEKDWDFAPVLVRALSEAGVGFQVALVISVYEEKDLAIVERIKKRITDVIGQEKLIYFQDLSQKEIADYYYLVDVFVMTSSFESFGKAAVEAMSRKCSVVSTSVGGLTEVVGKEENLFTKEGVGRFVKRVKELSEDPEELSKDREYFYQRYRENYTLEKHIERHAALYSRILSGTDINE